MKGFYIEIKNDLLEPKHVKAMGQAIWVYMWCLDKMTSVDESGVGKILGGKPIKSEDIAKELGVSRRYISTHLIRLSKTGYLNTKRTPYGYSITVNKAKKRFSQKAEMEQKGTSVGTKGNIQMEQKGTSVGTKGNIQMEQNSTNKEDKTFRQDSIQDNLSEQSSDLQKEENKHIGAIIQAFSLAGLEMGAPKYFIQAERDAASRLLKKFGLDEVIRAIMALGPRKTERFCPVVTKATQLERKYSEVIIFLRKNSNVPPVLPLGATYTPGKFSNAIVTEIINQKQLK